MTWTRITDDPATLPPMGQVVVVAFPNKHASFYCRTETEDGKWLWAKCYDPWCRSSTGQWEAFSREQDDEYQAICMWHPLPLPPEATP